MPPPLSGPPPSTTPLPPHPPLAGYYDASSDAAGSGGTARRDFLGSLFDATADDYDRVERLLAFGSGPWYRHWALRRAGLGEGAQVVDVGIGTGLVAREALKIIGPAGRVTGVDPSAGMMRHATLPTVELRAGRAEALPCDDGCADFLSMGYALRHVDDVAAAFAEFRRVLRPGGRLLVLEITCPSHRIGRALLKGYVRAVVPALARMVTRHADTARLWRYHWDTIEACIRPAAVLAALKDAGFTDVRCETTLGIFSDYTATRPT